MKSSHEFKMMGTSVTIFIQSKNAEEQCDMIYRKLQVYEKRFSAHDSMSELMALSHASGDYSLKVTPDLFELISLGKKHSLAHLSQLNIALGALIAKWKIGFSEAAIPDKRTIKRLLLLSQPEDIDLDENELTVFLKQKGMCLDLGALAKGYIGDQLMLFLKNEAVDAAMINLGGNVLVYGRNPRYDSDTWRVGIRDPKNPRGNCLGFLKIRDQSVVTSGIYERYFDMDGQIYHHILDRKTGYPIDSDMLSLSIVSDHSVDGEIWTSRLFGLPIKEVLKEVKKQPHIEALIVTKDSRIVVTEGLKRKFYSFYRE